MKTLFIVVAIIIIGVIGYIYLVSNALSAILSPHSLAYSAKTFDPLAKEILKQSEISSMDDCSRYTKKINDVRVKIEKDEQENDPFRSIQYYKQALDSMHIDHTLFNELRDKLAATQLREFYRSGDSILFVVDGFLDDSWGFIYCARPGGIDTGYVDFQGYTIRVVGNVNEHWKNASIN